jgi:integrase
VPILPALHRALIEWRLRSPYTRPADYVIVATEGKPVAYRNLRRALGQAINAASLDAGNKRLSWHSLRHSAGSMLVTELGLPPTTVARIMGHTDPGFTLRCYARDARDQGALTADVLARAERAGVGS